MVVSQKLVTNLWRGYGSDSSVTLFTLSNVNDDDYRGYNIILVWFSDKPNKNFIVQEISDDLQYHN